MELRKAEEDVQNLVHVYTSKVTGEKIKKEEEDQIAETSSSATEAGAVAIISWKYFHNSSSESGNNISDRDLRVEELVSHWLPFWEEEKEEENAEMTGEGAEDSGIYRIVVSPEELLETLQSMKDRIINMDGTATKFRERLHMKDPITNAPRYGSKTMQRVTSLLQSYDKLTQIINTAFGIVTSDNTTSSDTHMSSSSSLSTTSLVYHLQQEQLQKQHQEDTIQQQAKRQKELEQKEQERIEQEQQKREQEEQRQLELAKQREIELLATQAEQARNERLELERREREADRLFIEKVEGRGTIDGVRTQLRILQNSTTTTTSGGTKEDYTTAITALHTLFSQINAHPEEIKFRKIRMNHPKFLQDIGRHDGGQEVLVAAGFRLQVVDDDVKCLVLKEPDIESDMDGWTAWFDLMKNTLEVLEEELIKG